VKPATEYFSEDYLSDFKRHGGGSLCGASLSQMMRVAMRGHFPRLAEYALCQFALNLHNQIFFTHFPQLHGSWLAYSAPFGDTRICFSGHGLASHCPDSILIYVQEPFDKAQNPVRYTKSELADFISFFFGDYLDLFLDGLGGGLCKPSDYLRAVSGDPDCRVSLLTPAGWKTSSVTAVLRESRQDCLPRS